MEEEELNDRIMGWREVVILWHFRFHQGDKCLVHQRVKSNGDLGPVLLAQTRQPLSAKAVVKLWS